MPERITTPIPTQSPSVSPEREWEAQPDKLCPNQKIEITREVFPRLPD